MRVAHYAWRAIGWLIIGFFLFKAGQTAIDWLALVYQYHGHEKSMKLLTGAIIMGWVIKEQMRFTKEG